MCGYSGVKSFARFCLKQNNFVSISKRIAESDKKVDIECIRKNKVPGILA